MKPGRSRGWRARIRRSRGARADAPAVIRDGRPPRDEIVHGLTRERLPAFGDEQPGERVGAHRRVPSLKLPRLVRNNPAQR
jgi:hypothetical protein